ncbi:putative ubiquitin 1 [Fasciola gigantica]|uniref:Putative ubiquitin 1 n=1 Tax=Fasciola gigantica TaxID=46835 RepID=A0A504YL16_FASGI|nr:putative ubiquitin 1 [Fasciola gigantica]
MVPLCSAVCDAIDYFATMLIFVRGLAGTVIRLNVRPSESVENVKTRISQLKGIPVSQQHLIFDGVELSNTTLLASAQISHGALLRLVLGVRSGPLNRDTLGIAHSNGRFSSATRQTICPLTVPVAPMYRNAATTMVLPVLCTPNRGPNTEPHNHHHHHHLYKYHPYHPQLQYLTGSLTAFSSDQLPAYPTKAEWDDLVSYEATEFAMHEETIGSGDDAVSELAEYLEYAIDEEELNLEQSDKLPAASSLLEDDPRECVDQVKEGRHNLDVPSNCSTSSSCSIASSYHSSFVPSSASSLMSSEYQLFPVFSIPSQMQWIISPTNLTLSHPHQSANQEGLLDNPSRSSSSSPSRPVVHYAPVPVAYGIPLPLATPMSRCNPFSVSLETSPLDASNLLSTVNRNQPTQNSPEHSLTLAVPTHVAPVQLASFLPCSDASSIVSTTTATNDHNKATCNSITNATKHMPGLIIPSFTLLPVGHFGAAGTTSATSASIPADVVYCPRMTKMQQCKSIATTSSSTIAAPIYPPELSAISTQLSVPRNAHSNRSHIPRTKEQSVSTVESSILTSAVPITEQTHCFSCQKRTRPAQGFSCRCQKWFCQKHYHPEDHNCAFDFKKMRLIPSCSSVIPCPSSATGVGQSGSDTHQY